MLPLPPILSPILSTGLAASMGVGVATEMAKKALGLSRGKGSRAALGDVGAMVMSEANVERLVTTLCKMRGAALKLGQMISLQGVSSLLLAVCCFGWLSDTVLGRECYWC